MRIHQITDLHIPDASSRADLDHVKPNVCRQLAFIESDDSDLLVISGDLTMTDGSREGCEWLKAQLPDSVRTIIMPGNHDEPEVLWDVFGAERCIDQRFFYTFPTDHWHLVFLNTTTDYLPDEQIAFIASQVPAQPCVLFVHHPPDLVSDGFMAVNQPLMNHREAAQAIGESAIEHVFCGHYHNRAEKDCAGFKLYVTPSPAFQIDLHVREFSFQAFEPAVRVIELGPGTVDTRVEYV